jgi:hypothetical protein
MCTFKLPAGNIGQRYLQTGDAAPCAQLQLACTANYWQLKSAVEQSTQHHTKEDHDAATAAAATCAESAADRAARGVHTSQAQLLAKHVALLIARAQPA